LVAKKREGTVLCGARARLAAAEERLRLREQRAQLGARVRGGGLGVGVASGRRRGRGRGRGRRDRRRGGGAALFPCARARQRAGRRGRVSAQRSAACRTRSSGAARATPHLSAA
jgi:hypothetical protein